MFWEFSNETNWAFIHKTHTAAVFKNCRTMSRLLFDMGAKSMTALDKVGRSNAGTLPERYCGGGSGGEGNQPASECAAAPQEQGQSSSGSVGCCGQALVGGGEGYSAEHLRNSQVGGHSAWVLQRGRRRCLNGECWMIHQKAARRQKTKPQFSGEMMQEKQNMSISSQKPSSTIFLGKQTLLDFFRNCFPFKSRLDQNI